MYYTDDPVADYHTYAADQERELAKLPKCYVCGEAIQDDYCYMVNDEPVCEECMNRDYRVSTEELMNH